MATKEDGSLWAWGANHNGQLGDGTVTTYYRDEDDVFNKIYIEDNDRLTPVKVLDGVASVSANGVYTMAVKTNGELWGWGYNHYALLGENAYSTKPNPVKLMEGVLLPWQAPAPPAAVTKPTSSTVLVDGEAFLFDAYNINNNNYFKFRDIAQALDFGVTWDGANNTIIIDTSTGYSNE